MDLETAVVFVALLVWALGATAVAILFFFKNRSLRNLIDLAAKDFEALSSLWLSLGMLARISTRRTFRDTRLQVTSLEAGLRHRTTFPGTAIEEKHLAIAGLIFDILDQRLERRAVEAVNQWSRLLRSGMADFGQVWARITTIFLENELDAGNKRLDEIKPGVPFSLNEELWFEVYAEACCKFIVNWWRAGNRTVSFEEMVELMDKSGLTFSAIGLGSQEALQLHGYNAFVLVLSREGRTVSP